jgi:hypothetical protein
VATFSELVDEVLMRLSGYGVRNQSLTHLESGVTASADQITLNSTASVGRGVLEIGEELVWVDSYDRTSNVVEIPPYGRGFQGTQASTHDAGDMVTINPLFTRVAIKRAVNDAIQDMASKLYAVRTATFQFSPAINTYALPADVDAVLSVTFKTIGSSQEWYPVRRYRVDKSANVTAFGSNKTVTLNQMVDVGSTVQVTYATKPDLFESNTDDFETTTGFPVSAKDVAVLGASYHLLSFVEPGRLNFISPEANVQSDKIQFGSGTNVAKYVYALYQQRLQAEADKLNLDYPIRIRYSN